MCKDLIDRMPSVLQSAIEVAKNFSVNVGNDLRDLIVFGGGTRIPAVQAAILSLINKLLFYLNHFGSMVKCSFGNR